MAARKDNLSGRTALVTGEAKRLGREIALALAGDETSLVDRAVGVDGDALAVA